jgi:hypothetical protein
MVHPGRRAGRATLHRRLQVHETMPKLELTAIGKYMTEG